MTIFSRKAELDSVDAIAQHFVNSLGEADTAFIMSGKHDFGMVGRHIRNTYGLWNPEHPLTKNWHANEAGRKIIEGIDCSIDHPDNISAAILRKARKLLGVS